MNRTNRTFLRLAIPAMVLLLTARQAAAAERSWSNGGGDSLWSNPLNWSTGVKPASNDSVRLANNCPDEPQNIVLDEDAWLTQIICTATNNRHYTITPLANQFMRLNATYTINGTSERTVDLTINADVRVASEYLRVYCYGRDTVFNGDIGPSPTDQTYANVYVLAHYAGRLVLAGSNTITHVYGSTDSRVVAANPHAIGTYYRTDAAPKSLTLRQSVCLTGGMSPLLTLYLGGPLELGIEESGDATVELTAMRRTIGSTVTMTRGENSTGAFIVRAAGSDTYTTRWKTMADSALVMNNPSGTINWGTAGSDLACIDGPGALVCEAPSATSLYSTNTYTGGTFIRGGTLSLKGDNRLPTNGAVTVESAGTLYFEGNDQVMGELKGDGTNRFTWSTSSTPATNTVTALLSPGVDGPGTLTFTFSGRLVLTSATRSRFELDALNGNSDRIAFVHSAGHVILDGTLEVVNLGGMESGDYILFDLNGGTVSGGFDAITLPRTLAGTVEIIDGDVVLRAVKQHATVILLR